MKDEDEVYEDLAYVTSLHDEGELLTLYAVVCPEHGGRIVVTARDAVEAAQAARAMNPDCPYVPLALGLAPKVAVAIAEGWAQLFGNKEQGDPT